MPDASDPSDFRLVVAEIYDEVHRRRQAGEYPPGLERELDAVFAQHAPAAAISDDLGAVLDRAEQAAFVNADVPVASANPVARYVKLVIRKVLYWYVRYVTQQVGAMGGTLVRAVRMLARRVERLEHAVPGASPAVAAEVRALDPTAVGDEWVTVVVDRLAGVSGRVLHADCGAGEIVAALTAAGVDAYGCDPRREALGPATRAGLDVRAEDLFEHLAKLPAGSLAGVVLTGLVETASSAFLIDAVERITTALRPGGLFLVVSAAPSAWAHRAGTVAADLAAGHPLHADTWQYLLATRGYEPVDVIDGPAADGLQPVPARAAGAAVQNENIARLNAVLFGPASYAVVGRRGR